MIFCRPTSLSILLCLIWSALGILSLQADGRAGTVQWSDGKKAEGAISLSPGHQLRLFTNDAQVSISLDEVANIRFRPEKEEMREGFYFPDAGQATQAKTGEIYPSRALETEIKLSSGRVLHGHLFTTTLYLETDDATQKIVLMAKQTGANGQKLSDLVYPTEISFGADASSRRFALIDLTQADLTGAHQPVVVGRPDLVLLPLQQIDQKSIWTVPSDDPAQLFFAVEANDGWHVAWPDDSTPRARVDPDTHTAVQEGLKNLQDFYDTRTLLGCFSDADDVYSLVMMTRQGTTYSFAADKKPWSLVILRWKYDAVQKKVTLLNRAPLATGRTQGNSKPPPVFKNEDLLRDISSSSAAIPTGATP